MYYSYDPYGEFQFHDTAAEALKAFEEAVWIRKDSLAEGDCDDNMSDISWGPVAQRLTYEDRPLTAEEKEKYEWDFIREISTEDILPELARSAAPPENADTASKPE